MIIHPGLRDQWLKKNMPGQQDIAISRFRDLYNDFYASRALTSDYSEPLSLSLADDLLPNDFYDEEPAQTTKDEISEYLSDRLSRVEDPVAWWISNKYRFPTLFLLAMDLLSVPAMSSQCEREFSKAKLTIGPQRHSLEARTVEMLQCLRSWSG